MTGGAEVGGCSFGNVRIRGTLIKLDLLDSFREVASTLSSAVPAFGVIADAVIPALPSASGGLSPGFNAEARPPCLPAPADGLWTTRVADAGYL